MSDSMIRPAAPGDKGLWLDPEEAASKLYLPHQRWAVAKTFGCNEREHKDG